MTLKPKALSGRLSCHWPCTGAILLFQVAGQKGQLRVTTPAHGSDWETLSIWVPSGGRSCAGVRAEGDSVCWERGAGRGQRERGDLCTLRAAGMSPPLEEKPASDSQAGPHPPSGFGGQCASYTLPAGPRPLQHHPQLCRQPRPTQSPPHFTGAESTSWQEKGSACLCSPPSSCRSLHAHHLGRGQPPPPTSLIQQAQFKFPQKL